MIWAIFIEGGWLRLVSLVHTEHVMLGVLALMVVTRDGRCLVMVGGAADVFIFLH